MVGKTALYTYLHLDKKNKGSLYPVSYTHLDVYKRQVRAINSYHSVKTAQILLEKLEQLSVQIIALQEQAVSPVSYTHLDVYKRQTHTSL